MTLAVWIPGWYKLDPPLEVGLSDDFAFWRLVPDYLSEQEPLVLYNTLWHPENALIAHDTIAGIRQIDLGAIRKVDTRGLDYTITLADGTELLVNAEEQPGKLFERGGSQWVESLRRISNWRFIVEFAELLDLRRGEW